jgi:hypothetical protein
MDAPVDDDWEFYACLVDGENASIFVNLALAKVAPVLALTCMAYVRIYMREPRPDGLSSQEEYQALISLEDAVVPRLQELARATYVGRNTSGGCRDFYFYSPLADDWDTRVAGVMSSFRDYQYECGIREDPEWNTYFTFLYPSERIMQTIQNRRTCEALESKGDNRSQIREIDHWAYFHTLSARDQFVDAALRQGFALREMTEPSAEEMPFGAQVYRPDPPSDIDSPVLTLFDLAKMCGGDYDGWECPVVG